MEKFRMKTFMRQHPLLNSFITTGVIATLLSSSLVLTGCGVTREQVGTITGSVVGGAVGRQFGKGQGRDVMTVVGAVVGGLVGGSIARDMDQADQQRVSQTLDTAPNYEKVSWENQQTNRQYTVQPTSNYQGQVNGYQTQCRDYVMDAWIDGRMQQVKGRACKDNQGQWVNAS